MALLQRKGSELNTIIDLKILVIIMVSLKMKIDLDHHSKKQG
jgi:hypothetical protein